MPRPQTLSPFWNHGRVNPRDGRMRLAVSFFEGLQTPAGPETTLAPSCDRHLKPFTLAEILNTSLPFEKRPVDSLIPGRAADNQFRG
jgi:hypothetical protein